HTLALIDDELANIKLEGGIEFSVFLAHGDSSMDIVSPIEVSGVIRPAQSRASPAPTGESISSQELMHPLL
ncbi:hypothetical protein, partial [Pseudomonas syringae group sp. J309-1]|uniref:hypothetical protein n=1 Tax=Pseudomonas syringae group sp. J309-1 TaxID=3079588 RepID=UPI0029149571